MKPDKQIKNFRQHLRHEVSRTSQPDVAKRSGVGRSYIAKLILDSGPVPSLAVAIRLAECCDKSLGVMLLPVQKSFLNSR